MFGGDSGFEEEWSREAVSSIKGKVVEARRLKVMEDYVIMIESAGKGKMIRIRPSWESNAPNSRM